MSESRILILEGLDGDTAPLSAPPAKRGVREFHACKVGRKVQVFQYPLERAPSVACQNNTRFHVEAKTKKQAHKLAVQKFREERAAKKAKRALSGTSPAQSAAQRRFAAAAHSCQRQSGGGGKNRSYLACMTRALKSK